HNEPGDSERDAIFAENCEILERDKQNINEILDFILNKRQNLQITENMPLAEKQSLLHQCSVRTSKLKSAGLADNHVASK
ncbi:hypothetical protein U2446_15255, partial [Listeria monocytogenes]|uniref:hypothetical protein n=1 Tax=Listeria monocytogenes TaxID=1639 RepID=UPI002FDC681D